MDILINVGGAVALLYLIVWIGEYVKARISPPKGPGFARMQHEQRMLKRRADKAYRI